MVFKNVTEQILVRIYQTTKNPAIRSQIFSDLWTDYKNCGIKWCNKVNYLIPGEDLEQYRMMGFDKALQEFNEDKGVDFLIVVMTYIRNEVLTNYTYELKHRKLKEAYFVDERSMQEDDNKLLSLFFKNYVYDEINDQECIDIFRNLKNILNEKELEVVNLKLSGREINSVPSGTDHWRRLQVKVRKFLRSDEKQLNFVRKMGYSY